MLSHALLPFGLMPACLDVLLKLSDGERDFLQVVVEVVQNHRFDANIAGSQYDKSHAGSDDDEDDDDDLVAEELTGNVGAAAAAHAARKEVKFQAPAIDAEKAPVHLRCLAIVRHLLERILGALSDNAMFVGLVHELIVPSVRCKIPDVREQGMVCLGLCSLLDKNMALDSFGLFVNQSQTAEGELKVRVYEVVFDILMLYGVDFLAERGHGVRLSTLALARTH
jgi:condensin complex subunit 3